VSFPDLGGDAGLLALTWLVMSFVAALLIAQLISDR
jgi:hypothetical protein